MNAIQKEVISKFDFPGEVVECIPYGSGHINDTYRLTVHTPGGQDKRFILQRMNKSIFTKPVELYQSSPDAKPAVSHPDSNEYENLHPE